MLDFPFSKPSSKVKDNYKKDDSYITFVAYKAHRALFQTTYISTE